MSFVDNNYKNENKYIVVYKREYSPSEDEIAARRNGEEWNEEVAEEYRKRREAEEEAEKEKSLKSTTDPIPKSNYKEKYVHLIGEKAALEAAKKTETNKSYGFGEFDIYSNLSTVRAQVHLGRHRNRGIRI